MNENERLYEQYEDALFVLLMNRVAEETGKELMQKNEELLSDPNAAVPEALSKRCLRTIEKAYRKSQWKAAAKKVTRALNRVALWILIPLFLFGGAFAASETVRVKTLNFLMTSLNVGTEFRIGSEDSSDSQQSIQSTIDDCIPSDYDLISKDSSSLCEKYIYANDLDSTLCVTVYALEASSGAITIDTEDANVWYNTIHEQRVMFVRKENTYQATWTDEATQKMYVVFGGNTAPDVVDGIVEKMLLSNLY